MSPDRRRFLQGCGGASLLVAAPVLLAHARPISLSARRMTAAPAARLLLLRSPGDDFFGHAALATARSTGATQIESLDLSVVPVRAPGALRALLEPRRGATLLGLMDDCTHALLDACIRDLGGALLCCGQHYGTLASCSDSRHLFASSGAAHGIGAALARALAASGGAFLVREQALGAAARTGTRVAPRLDAHWPAALGYAYAQIAAGRWQPRPVAACQQRGSFIGAAGAQARVSLVARI
jgi:hypothetical protein